MESYVSVYSINGDLVHKMIVPKGYHEVSFNDNSKGLHIIRVNEKVFKFLLR